jgi:hypothetical protein
VLLWEEIGVGRHWDGGRRAVADGTAYGEKRQTSGWHRAVAAAMSWRLASGSGMASGGGFGGMASGCAGAETEAVIV